MKTSAMILILSLSLFGSRIWASNEFETELTRRIPAKEKTKNFRVDLGPTVMGGIEERERITIGFDFGITPRTALGLQTSYGHLNMMGYDLFGIGVGPRLSICSQGRFKSGWCVNPETGIYYYSASKSVSSYDYPVSQIDFSPFSVYLGASGGYQWFFESGFNMQASIGGTFHSRNRVVVSSWRYGSSGTTSLNPELMPELHLELGYSF